MRETESWKRKGFPPAPMTTAADRTDGATLAVLTALAVLWAQLYWACSYAWLAGDYYDYGWYVPPLAAWFFVRRWRDQGGTGPGIQARGAAVAALLLLPALVVVRVLGQVDPNWRLPILAEACLVAATTIWILARSKGWAALPAFVPVLLFALSAVPYPTVVEQGLVRTLTRWVVQVASEGFNLWGRPTQAIGDRLASLGVVVEVTEGCSGIRSLQSFLMAGLFFGELHRLAVPRRIVLMAGACLLALVVNAARAMTLAAIRFDHGEEAFANAHDWVGLAAFVASALSFLVLSGLLARRRFATRRRVLGAASPGQ